MSAYFSRVESKLSEFPPPNHQWFLMVHHDPEQVPPLRNGRLSLLFKETVTQREAEQFEKLFDRLIDGISYQER